MTTRHQSLESSVTSHYEHQGRDARDQWPRVLEADVSRWSGDGEETGRAPEAVRSEESED